MSRSNPLASAAALAEGASGGVAARSDASIVLLSREPAGNDATCEDRAIAADEAGPPVPQPLAANDGGMAAIIAAAWCALPPSYTVYRAADAHRAVVLGEMIAVAIEAAGALVRRVHERHQKRRRAKAIHDALQDLDDRTLRDLGFDRSELTSVAAEVTGDADCTRVRALQTMHGLPI